MKKFLLGLPLFCWIWGCASTSAGYRAWMLPPLEGGSPAACRGHHIINHAEVQADVKYAGTLLDEAKTALEQGQGLTLEKLLSQDPTLITQVDEEGNTLLHLAVEQRNCKLVKLVLRHQPDAYAQNEHGNTALHTAALRGDEKVVMLLVEEIPDLLLKKNEQSMLPEDFAFAQVCFWKGEDNKRAAVFQHIQDLLQRSKSTLKSK